MTKDNLLQLLHDIKQFDIENLVLDLPHDIRARIELALVGRHELEPDHDHCAIGVDPCPCAKVALKDATRYAALSGEEADEAVDMLSCRYDDSRNKTKWNGEMNLPNHRCYNWFLLWPAIRAALIWALLAALLGALFYVTSHWIDEADARMQAIHNAKVEARHASDEHAARLAMLEGLRTMSRNGSLTETDVREGTVCEDGLRIGK